MGINPINKVLKIIFIDLVFINKNKIIIEIKKKSILNKWYNI